MSYNKLDPLPCPFWGRGQFRVLKSRGLTTFLTKCICRTVTVPICSKKLQIAFSSRNGSFISYRPIISMRYYEYRLLLVPTAFCQGVQLDFWGKNLARCGLYDRFELELVPVLFIKKASVHLNFKLSGISNWDSLGWDSPTLPTFWHFEISQLWILFLGQIRCIAKQLNCTEKFSWA